MTIREHDMVVLTRDLPQFQLHAGDVGAVIHVCDEGKAFEVEFVNGAGDTLAVATLESASVRAMNGSEILHTRNVSAA